jgi:signal transduction histidine kinase
MTRWTPSQNGLAASWFIIGICAAVAVLAWFGYTAGREWRRNSELLVSRRAEEMADLVARALVRDMRGVQEKVLRDLPPQWITEGQPHDLVDLVATAFARYPYPECFFAWSGHEGLDRGVFLTRADRAPTWLPSQPPLNPFPVMLVEHAAVSRPLTAGAIAAGAVGRPFAVFATTLGGDPYQVVASLIYETSRHERVVGVFGFLVNLRWAEESYFREITTEVQQVFGTGDGLTVSVQDDRGTVLAGTDIPDGMVATAARHIRPLFFDPTLMALGQADRLPTREWTVRVSAADDPAYAFALRGAGRTLSVTTAAAIAFGFGLLMTARALRASADLAQLRADFVSSVTHELKTPLSIIRAVGDALARGRVSGAGGVREYAQIVDQESKRLTRLVDNLLAYSRVTDVGEVYSFEQLAIADVVDDIVRRFQPQFGHGKVDVHIDIPPELPPVIADRTALELVMDNLVDNAMRYSGAGAWIAITAHRVGTFARIVVRDKGMGIPAEQLGRVEARFVRGRRSGIPGSGLGLAIASRIIRDHGGRLEIQSQEGHGTSVHVDLPVFTEAR